MITMKITRFRQDDDNTPIISNKEIEDFAYDVLADYNPKLLREPGTINYEHFIESYLGVEIIYRDIYYKKNTPQIHGITVFRDGIVKVFDWENRRVAYPIVRANTIILDNSITDNSGLAMFTGLHETGHIFMHKNVFSIFRAGQICCRKENERKSIKNPLEWTAEEWREHHANHFAGAIAMPDTTFIPFVNKVMREYGVYKRSIVLGQNKDLDILAKYLLPDSISEVYGVSREAALTKLKKKEFVLYK